VYYLLQTLALNPPEQLEFESRLALAEGLDQIGGTDQAVEELRNLVAKFPDSAEAHNNLGNAYARCFRYKEARDEYEQALRIEPSNSAAGLSLAKARLKKGETTAAISTDEDYILRLPGDYEGFFVLGTAYQLQGDFHSAEEQLRRAVRLKPDNYQTRCTLGMVLAQTGRIM